MGIQNSKTTNTTNTVVPLKESTINNVKSDLESDVELNCSICLSEIDDVNSFKTLKCSHTFHIKCIDEWNQRQLSFQRNCPNCRAKVDFKPSEKSCTETVKVSRKLPTFEQGEFLANLRRQRRGRRNEISQTSSFLSPYPYSVEQRPVWI